MSWISSIIVGLLAGLIGSKLMGSESKGCLMNLILGLLGSIVGGWVYNLLGAQAGVSFWAQLVVSVVGACVILFIARLLRG